MSDQPPSPPSFSTAARWRIGLDVVLRTALVLAVAGMVNYLGVRFYHRYYWSSQTRMELSSHTLTVLNSLTNHVAVTLYYDEHADFYSDIKGLLDAYRAANKNLTVDSVDYNRDPGKAEIIKEKYQKYFPSESDKDLVIFDCEGRVKVVPGTELSSYETKLKGEHPSEKNPQKPELEFERRPVSFNGELAFTSVLQALASPQPLKACFLQGQGEVSLTDTDDRGYQEFAKVLRQNYIEVTNLRLGDTGVPLDCNLLIIAAPRKPFEPGELQQIDQYLREGGRLLALFTYVSQTQPNGAVTIAPPTGLETILRTWGVDVENDIAQDFNYSTTPMGTDIKVWQYGNHPVVNSVAQSQLQIYLPHPVLKQPTSQAANAPEVKELFATSPGGTLMFNPNEPPQQYPLACAAEQKPVAGVTYPRGNTRIIAVGDAAFLGNTLINSGGNRDFLNAAVNWLCDRPQWVAGIGPRPVNNIRLQMTRHELRQLTWLLLLGLPGSVLFLGWLVWLVRRR
jgi:hypothetical protein